MKYLKYIILLLCFVACKEEKKAPIDKDTFTSLLIDIHTMEGYASTVNNRRSSDDKLRQDLKHTVYDKYNISKELFDSCVTYYSHNIEQYAKIYEVVIDSLNRRNSRVEIILAENRKRDTMNIWTGKDSLSFKSDSISVYEHSELFKKRGGYRLSLEVKIGDNDKGINNRLVGYIKTVSDSIIQLDTVKIKKDTAWQYYQVERRVDSMDFEKIVFKLMDCDNLNSLKERDVLIRNIKFTNPVNLIEGDFRHIKLNKESLRHIDNKLKRLKPLTEKFKSKKFNKAAVDKANRLKQVDTEKTESKLKVVRRDSNKLLKSKLKKSRLKGNEIAHKLDSALLNKLKLSKARLNIDKDTISKNIKDTSKQLLNRSVIEKVKSSKLK